MQRDFINGTMGPDERVSYERYCRYMISQTS